MVEMMDVFSGTALIVWLQQFSPALDLPFRMVTLLGSEAFFLLFLPLIYWCVHRRIGAGLAVLFLISASLNAILKAAWGMPRPFVVDPAVVQLAAAAGNGFPSGHTQGALVVWTYLAFRFKRAWLWWLAGILVLAIPLSRLYLGVHFPLDLAGGYVIGGLLVFSFIIAENPTAEMVDQCSAGMVTAALFAATAAALFSLTDQGPYVVSTVAALTGTSWGLFMERRWIGIQIRMNPARRSVRYLAGIAGLLAIYFGLKMGWAGLEPSWLFRAIRYGLVGFWIAAGAPLLFQRFIK